MICDKVLFGFQIKLALYSDGKEVAYVTFTTNGYVTTHTNWFSYNHVISSSWTDIGKNPADYQMFSVYDAYK